MNNELSHHIDGVIAHVKNAIVQLCDPTGSSFKSIQGCLACDASEDLFIRAALNKGTKEKIFKRLGNRWLVAIQSHVSGGNVSINSNNNIPAVQHGVTTLRRRRVLTLRKMWRQSLYP